MFSLPAKRMNENESVTNTHTHNNNTLTRGETIEKPPSKSIIIQRPKSYELSTRRRRLDKDGGKSLQKFFCCCCSDEVGKGKGDWRGRRVILYAWVLCVCVCATKRAALSRERA